MAENSEKFGAMHEVQDQKERAILVGLFRSSRERAKAEESLLELSELALAADAVVLESVLQERDHPDPAYFVGKGKIEEIAKRVQEASADILIFDDDLSPRQKANIEEAADCKTVDRTQVILDIFAQRARTKEGKLQVELAQLLYMLPHLTGKGVELSRLGGGIGTRGPGETKLEVDRRRIKRKIQWIREELESVRRNRALHRQKRKESATPTVALVGYTNAGKSTLFNRLTEGDAFVSDQLFATLDPLLRRAKLPNGQEILVSDTVGFIKKLPHDLVAAFRATLEEVAEADLLLHVIDISEDNYLERIKAVEEVLAEIEVGNAPCIKVFNKMDRLVSHTEDLARRVDEGNAQGVLISALTGQGVDKLLAEIAARLESRVLRATFHLPYAKANLLPLLHEKGKVLKETFTNDGIQVEAEIPRSIAEQNQEFITRIFKS